MTRPRTLSDTTRPDPARVLNHWLGGNASFAADRDAGEMLLDPAKGHPGLRALARENRRFVLKAAAWLARNYGTGQFLDLGCGLPVSPAVHDAARDVIPDAAVAYVDRDPMVTAHVAALQAGPGLAAVLADVTDPASVLGDPAVKAVIDLARPVAVILGGTLSDMPAGVARSVVAGFAAALAPGSAIVASCASFDDEAVAGRIAAVLGGGAWRNHGRDDVASFFGGLRLVAGEAGDVRCWPLEPSGCGRTARVLGGVGIKE